MASCHNHSIENLFHHLFMINIFIIITTIFPIFFTPHNPFNQVIFPNDTVLIKTNHPNILNPSIKPYHIPQPEPLTKVSQIQVNLPMTREPPRVSAFFDRERKVSEPHGLSRGH
ncbi:Peptidase S1, PA clan [Parasponia andersonii]|uniref:Peptidase S1, PA clan n=1 Tax=Parasponia andersonii TaxID=3476 RepID=A0A2P5D6I6_PARAD|nr:Peptidase S1, PA clan [Parasponia andersonii]